MGKRSSSFVLPVLLAALVQPAVGWAYEKEIKAASATLADSIAKAGRKSVAVVDFTDLQGNVTELGRFVAEQISVALAASGKPFEVVERTHLKALLKEHRLADSGVIDPQTARKLGQIAGVEALVTGTLTPFGDSVNLSVKALDAATARLLGAASADIPKTKAIDELLSKGIGTTTGAPTATSATSSPGSTPGAAASKVQVRDFAFESSGCRALSGTLSCDVLITSVGPDQDLRLTGSRVLDRSGNEYHVAQIRFGAQSWKAPRDSIQEILFPGPSSLVPSGLAIKATLTFTGVSLEMNAVALLELNCSATRGDFAAQLRNIPVEKRGPRQ
jgi:TolB-like protein